MAPMTMSAVLVALIFETAEGDSLACGSTVLAINDVSINFFESLFLPGLLMLDMLLYYFSI